MEYLDKEIIKIITKYPFLTDPIVLFNPEVTPKRIDLLHSTIALKYPNIEKHKKNIKKIKKDFYRLIDILQKTIFDSIYLKIEYAYRLKDFYNVIRIIEVFYDDNEYEKYNLINEYFGINFELLEEIFINKDVFEKGLYCKNPLLSSKKIIKLEEKMISPEGIKYYFDEALLFLGQNKNWKVVVGDAVSIIHTNFNKKGGEIIIPKTYTVSAKKLLALIAHEIDGHCVQFTNCDNLSTGGIRFSKSESLAEGFALYNEYLFLIKVFGERRTERLYEKNKIKFGVINYDLSNEDFLGFEDIKYIRFFRGFSNIKKYKNLKDFVYIQGLYQVLKYSKKYSNTFSLLKSGAINDSYIKKYGIEGGKKEKIDINNMSAYFVLKKYF